MLYENSFRQFYSDIYPTKPQIQKALKFINLSDTKTFSLLDNKAKEKNAFLAYQNYVLTYKKKLNYIGYGGKGHQVRDVLHIDDLKKLIFLQIKKLSKINNKIFTVGGSIKNKISLIELTKICQKITGNEIKIGKIKKTSNYDIPIFITNNSKVSKTYGWKVEKDIYEISQDVYKWLSNNKKLIKKYF